MIENDAADSGQRWQKVGINWVEKGLAPFCLRVCQDRGLTRSEARLNPRDCEMQFAG